MTSFEAWSEESETEVNGHNMHLVTLKDGLEAIAQEKAVGVLPDHYASPSQVANILDKLGKKAAAEYLRQKLPTKQSLQSGDLGEIFATEYVEERTEFSAPVKRLRWRDHREMAMRGDDVIGIRAATEEVPINFLKVEAKSEAALKTRTVASARTALNSDNGLPSPHALAFIADRLHEIGEEDLSDAIFKALLSDGISADQVQHLLFTFSGNDPKNFLQADLDSCDANISKTDVGLRMVDHQNFIKKVFEEVFGI
ncbi:Hachiman antiphage defense system protein HamA [Mameliella sp.]|uniref:Hachiman antiphage defense system protein HamA n=1 Tax=Mameliella sp. TaxID=1924940 RepID=UPI003BAA94D9